MKRLHQCVLIASFVPLCWLGMMGVHELGHVVAGWASGGHVQKVVLHPLAISRTDIEPNPHPSIVVWAGPIIGVLLPLLMWSLFYFRHLPGEFLLKFFAGFCLIANGAYIGVGAIDGIGDAGQMLQHGSPAWMLILFGVTTVPFGFWLWHGLGPYFGLSKSKGKVQPWAAYCSLGILIVALITAILISPRA